jgi:hypothetical protein
VRVRNKLLALISKCIPNLCHSSVFERGNSSSSSRYVPSPATHSEQCPSIPSSFLNLHSVFRLKLRAAIPSVVVVVIKKEPNQLYGAVGTVARLGITRVRVKKIQRYLLIQILARRTLAPFLIAMKLKSCNMSWYCQAFLSHSVVEYVISNCPMSIKHFVK